MKILVILLISIVIVNGNAIPETEIAEELETIGAEAHGRMDAEADGRMDEEEDAESDVADSLGLGRARRNSRKIIHLFFCF